KHQCARPRAKHAGRITEPVSIYGCRRSTTPGTSAGVARRRCRGALGSRAIPCRNRRIAEGTSSHSQSTGVHGRVVATQFTLSIENDDYPGKWERFLWANRIIGRARLFTGRIIPAFVQQGG